MYGTKNKETVIQILLQTHTERERVITNASLSKLQKSHAWGGLKALTGLPISISFVARYGRKLQEAFLSMWTRTLNSVSAFSSFLCIC